MMPELPEVAALVEFLDSRAAGMRLVRVDVASVQVLSTYEPPSQDLHGRRLHNVRRHGKFIDLNFEGLHLMTHLARAGWLRWSDGLSPAPLRPGKGPIALRAAFEDGSGFDLTEAGTKKSLSVYVVSDPQQVPRVASLGIDPLSPEFTVEALTALFAGRRTQLKGVLRDQRLIAGIGNAYSDEILHAAKISPFKLADSLTAQEAARLHQAATTVLTTAVQRSRGLAAKQIKSHKQQQLRVHGRAGQECGECGDVIREVVFADSALQYCPDCQTAGKLLADRRMSRLLK